MELMSAQTIGEEVAAVPREIWLGVAIALALFFIAALAASINDVKTRALPNVLLGVMFAAALIFQMFRSNSAGVFSLFPSPFFCMWGCIFFMVAFFILEAIWRKANDASGFGAGDIKFIGAWALFMGPMNALVAGAAGAFLGAIFSIVKKEKAFPAGPWIMVFSTVIFILASCNILSF